MNTTSSNPDSVDVDTVHPKPGLGGSFETPAYPALLFSTKTKIWGDKLASAMEPTDPAWAKDGLKSKTLVNDGHRCMFCGLHSIHNQVHNLNDNHRDIRPENLRTADPLCHGWQHLGELGEGNAVVAYLPGLTGQDVNHLQRAIMVALHSNDAAMREDAGKLLNWLASHRDYVADAWGTYEPEVFASALARLKVEDRDKREVAFEYLAVAFNPAPYVNYAASWAREMQASYPVAKWGRVYHDIINSAA